MKSKYKCFGNRAILNSDYTLSCVNSAVFVVRVIRNGKWVSWWVFLHGLFLNWIGSLIWFTVHTNTSVGTAQRAMQGWAQTNRETTYFTIISYDTSRPRESHTWKKCLLQHFFGRRWSSWCSLFLTETINSFTSFYRPKKNVQGFNVFPSPLSTWF